jgi:hypothetical protein
MELAQELCFDEATIDSNLTPAEINSLTAPGSLGPEDPTVEKDLKTFNDIDDWNNFQIVDSTMQGIVGTYKTKFSCYYVNPLNIDQVSASRTFAKRLDISVWRLKPPSNDTLKTSMVMGYFHFD